MNETGAAKIKLNTEPRINTEPRLNTETEIDTESSAISKEDARKKAVRARGKLYRERNRDKDLARKKDYRARNKEKISISNRAYRELQAKKKADALNIRGQQLLDAAKKRYGVVDE